jgi:phosphoserine phosphatase
MIAESHIVSLVSDPARPAIATALLARLEMELPEAVAPVWLAEGIAADIGFTPPPGTDLAALAGTLRGMLGDAPVDLNLLAAGGRRKRLFVADMDSTMIGQECIDELADFAGLKAHVAAITERAMRGEIAFEPAVRERVALLRDLPVSVVAETLAGRITLTPGGETLVCTMRAAGGYAALVSGGFTVFTGAIAERIGFDEHRGNVLDFAGDLFAGTVAEPILGREAKLATLIELRERLGLAHGETLAVGDGANDLAMLQEAGLGVAFRAKPAVAAAAHARVQHGDLTALLYLQGYRRDEFVEG